MRFCQNKKSLVESHLVQMLILTAGFLLIITIVWNLFQGKAEAKTKDSICRGSVAAREKTYYEIYDPTGIVKLETIASPLLCETIDKYVPEDKDATKENIEREFANLMTSCWWRYGEGFIQDVFKKGDLTSKNCQVCYMVSLKKTSKFNDKVKSVELLQFMTENPYKVSPKGDNCRVNGGFCIDSENKNDCLSKINADTSYLLMDKKDTTCQKIGKSSCCYTDYECWNRGGICSGDNPDSNLYARYDDGWKCPSKMKCYVKKEDYYSYYDYIRGFGGPGNIIITTDIEPSETYAISFGSPTGECGICTLLGIGGGTAAGAAAVGGAIALGIPTGGIGGVAVLFGLGFFAGYAGVRKPAQESMKAIFTKRDINTIYLTTLNQIQKGDVPKDAYCKLVKDIRGA